MISTIVKPRINQRVSPQVCRPKMATSTLKTTIPAQPARRPFSMFFLSFVSFIALKFSANIMKSTVNILEKSSSRKQIIQSNYALNQVAVFVLFQSIGCYQHQRYKVFISLKRGFFVGFREIKKAFKFPQRPFQQHYLQNISLALDNKAFIEGYQHIKKQ